MKAPSSAWTRNILDEGGSTRGPQTPGGGPGLTPPRPPTLRPPSAIPQGSGPAQVQNPWLPPEVTSQPPQRPLMGPHQTAPVINLRALGLPGLVPEVPTLSGSPVDIVLDSLLEGGKNPLLFRARQVLEEQQQEFSFSALAKGLPGLVWSYLKGEAGLDILRAPANFVEQYLWTAGNTEEFMAMLPQSPESVEARQLMNLAPAELAKPEDQRLWARYTQEYARQLERWGEISRQGVETGQWPDAWSQFWAEGKIAYSLLFKGPLSARRGGAAGETRLEQLRADVAAGMNLEDAVVKYEDFWTEFIWNGLLLDPANMLPSGALDVLLPPLAGAKAAARGAKGVIRAAAKRIRAVAWLTDWTKMTIMHAQASEVTDAVGRLMAQSPKGVTPAATGGVDKGYLAVIDKFLAGIDPPESLDPDTLRVLGEWRRTLNGEGVRSLEDLIAKNIPKMKDMMTDETWLGVIGKKPERILYFVNQSSLMRLARELGVPTQDEIGALDKVYRFTAGLLKEHLLGVNPAYIVGNWLDNTVKCWLNGHFINPFDLGAEARVVRVMQEVGETVPQTVLDDFINDQLGLTGASRMSRLPVIGIGKPSDMVDSLNYLLGRDLREVKWVDYLAPGRETRLEQLMEIRHQQSLLARVVDKLNWATLNETGMHLSGAIEKSARAQIFLRTFEDLMPGIREEVLSPQAVRYLDPALLQRLRNPSLVRSAQDVLGLAKMLDTPSMPSVSLSSLAPADLGDVDLVRAVADEMDNLQRLALARGDAGSEALSGQLSDLMDKVEWALAALDDDNLVQETLVARWRADRVRGAVRSVYDETRVARDELLELSKHLADQDAERAPAIWHEYFRLSDELAEDMLTEVRRVLGDQDVAITPALQKKLDDLLKMVRNTPAHWVKDLTGDDATVFGQQLALRRFEVDEWTSKAWNLFLEDPTPERLGELIRLTEQTAEMASNASRQAAAIRKSLLSGSPASPDQYREAVDAVWKTVYFDPATSAWQKTVEDLGGGMPQPVPGILYGEPGREILLPSGASVPGTVPELEALHLRGQLTDEELEFAKSVVAQKDFEMESVLGRARQNREVLERLKQEVPSWRARVMGEADNWLSYNAWEEAYRLEQTVMLKEIAQNWSAGVRQASAEAALEVNRVLFNYANRQNWEDALGYVFPFVKWQVNNPFLWTQMISQRPWIASMMKKYVDLSANERERYELSTRFENMAPLPGQEWLMDKGVIPEGYYGIDPRSLLSISGQLREPYYSPEEEEMTGARRVINRALRIPESLGLNPYPWLQAPLEAMGLYGNRPPSGLLGPASRLEPYPVRALQDWIPEDKGGPLGWLRDANLSLLDWEQQTQERRVPGSSWLREYLTRRQLSFMVQEGRLTAQEAQEGMYDPESAAYKQAQEEVLRDQELTTFVRAMVPFGVKRATPGEMQIRQKKEDISGMPEAQAAGERNAFPAVGVYGRAVAGVDNPEWAEWASKRDAIYSRYTQLFQDMLPWDPRRTELMQQRQAEIDALGEEPARIDWTTGRPRELGDQDDVLFQLESMRPRAQDFADEEGVINWEAYNQATDLFLQDIPMWSANAGFPVTVEQYQQFRRRYLTPEELAWELRQGQLDSGWDRYGSLREMGVPEDWDLGYQLEEGREPLFGELQPEVAAWLQDEYRQRRSQGWGPRDLVEWARGQELPYERILELLQQEGYGPRQVGEMHEDVLTERPWLRGLAAQDPRWGRIDALWREEMPGLSVLDTTTFEPGDDLVDQYYNLMPRQRRELRELLSLPEDPKALQQYFRDNPDTEIDWAGIRVPTEDERLRVELDMTRWSNGRGEWTAAMDEWYGDPNSPSNKFWDFYYANKDFLIDAMREDDVVQALMSKDVRSVAGAEFDALYEEGFKRLSTWYYDPDKTDTPTEAEMFWGYYYANQMYFSDDMYDDPLVQAALSKEVRTTIQGTGEEFNYEAWKALQPLFRQARIRLADYYLPEEKARLAPYGNLIDQAKVERKEFLSIFDYDARPREKAAENAWWDARSDWMRAHPVMTWVYYYDNYLKWWGTTPPGEAAPQGGGSPTPVLSQPEGGGGGGEPEVGPPTPPEMPLPPPPPSLPSP